MTKPKSAAEAVRLTEAVGYGLVIRKRANETSCGLLGMAMRGDPRPPEEKSETMDWWYSRMCCHWRSAIPENVQCVCVCVCAFCLYKSFNVWEDSYPRLVWPQLGPAGIKDPNVVQVCIRV